MVHIVSHSVAFYGTSSGGSNLVDELSQIKSLKEKKEDWQSSVAEATAERKTSTPLQLEEVESGKVRGNLDRFSSGVQNAVVVDEDKLKELESLSGQIGDVKNKWRTGEIEKAEEKEDTAKIEELEELKKAGVNVKERFKPPTESDVQKSYDRSELENSGAADARKSFIHGSAFETGVTERSAAKELENLKFTELNSYKNKFERGLSDETHEKTTIEQLDIQLKNLRQAFEKPEAEMSLEERAELKKKEIEEEFLRYKMARKLREKQGKSDAAEEELGVKSVMEKFNNIEGMASKQIETNLDELEALRIEAKNLRQRFENANPNDNGEISEERKKLLDEEFALLKDERERARKQFEEEQALANANAPQKEDIQIAAEHASKMTAKWEKIHKKEAKKAEKSKMPQKPNGTAAE